MSKEMIAVDIDDTIADHAAAFIEFSNTHYGTELTKETYSERWDKIWQIDDWDEILRRADEFHTPDSIVAYDLVDDAQEVLTELSEVHPLAIVTARPRVLHEATHSWLQQHFSGLFSEVHFVPIWEPNNQVSKADICQQIDAPYLIDDVVKHCNLAVQGDIKALLFGGFQWHSLEDIDDRVVPVDNWPTVLEYFDGRG